MTAPVEALLVVEDLRLAFGGVKAVDGLGFRVMDGDILSVIGPNGAGKTSAFNCISGFYKPTGGRITFLGQNVTGMRPSAMAARGISRTFQNLRLFGDLTVLDNVRAGMHLLATPTASATTATWRSACASRGSGKHPGTGSSAGRALR